MEIGCAIGPRLSKHRRLLFEHVDGACRTFGRRSRIHSVHKSTYQFIVFVIPIAIMPSTGAVRSAEAQWPARAPTLSKLKATRQIRYIINHKTKTKQSGLVNVWAYNTMGGEPYDWRWVPKAYTEHLLRLNYRFDLYMTILDKLILKKGKDTVAAEVMETLKKYVSYLENVMDAIWAEVRDAELEDQLTPGWRSSHLNLWLTKEYHIGRHDQMTVMHFRTVSDNINLNDDALELGKLSLSIYALSNARDQIGRSTRPPRRPGILGPSMTIFLTKSLMTK
jgi:hypothetical protein